MANIILGTWSWGAGMFGGDSVFGSHTDEHILQPFFDAATEAGLRTWDTATAYAMGNDQGRATHHRCHQASPRDRSGASGRHPSDALRGRSTGTPRRCHRHRHPRRLGRQSLKECTKDKCTMYEVFLFKSVLRDVFFVLLRSAMYFPFLRLPTER